MRKFINDFRLNHVGFPCDAKKTFVYMGAPAEYFTVKKMRNGVLEPVFSGKLAARDADPVSDKCLTGDFSQVTEEGVYRIYCGDNCSRTFYIGKNIYDSVCRTLTMFFVWQRCGHETGWNGCCHSTDHIVDKHGVEHSLVGGHHQSGDLRKWAFGVPDGIWGLSEYFQLKRPGWNRGDIEYDIAHSARYYISRISEEGYVYDCTFVPEGYDNEACHGVGYENYGSFWEPFQYFDTPTDAQGHWHVIRMLASAARSLSEYDTKLANECFEGAQKVWNYMQETGEHIEGFEWKIYPPIGHDTFKQNLFDYYYPGSAFMLCGRAFAAMELYKTQPKPEFHDKAIDALNRLASYMVKDETGALKYFRLGDKDGRIAEGIRYCPFNIPLAFADAMLLWPEDPGADIWLDCIEASVKKYEKQASGNAYGKVTNHCIPTNNSSELEWDFWAPSFNNDLSHSAQFLCKVSSFKGREKCLGIAQRLLDFILGANPTDSSCVEGVGYNQPPRAIFGEFFPAQPQIPGGVFTDIEKSEPDFSGYGREYDMPIVGNFLYSLALYQEVVSENKRFKV